MQPMDAARAGDIKSDEHLSSPALDPADTACTGFRRGDRRADFSRRQPLDERLDQADRFEHLLEAHRDARGDVAARVRGHARIELLPGRDRIVDA